MSRNLSLEVRVHAPPEDLQPYLNTVYFTDLRVKDDRVVSDTLQPEWANLRLSDRSSPDIMLENRTRVAGTRFCGTGPSSKAGRFTWGTIRSWGISFSPLGWARFVGAPAVDYANIVVDGYADPAFGQFAPLADTLFDPEPDEDAEFERIITFLRNFPAHPTTDEARIVAIHAAMTDPEVNSVADMAQITGIAPRTLERLCKRHFGFTTKLLLRRQRFMRSLARFSLDPSTKWIDALDPGYHDQAQFVRDFREFMGTTPSAFLAQPHPILGYFTPERNRIYGGVGTTILAKVGVGDQA